MYEVPSEGLGKLTVALGENNDVLLGCCWDETVESSDETKIVPSLKRAPVGESTCEGWVGNGAVA